MQSYNIRMKLNSGIYVHCPENSPVLVSRFSPSLLYFWGPAQVTPRGEAALLPNPEARAQEPKVRQAEASRASGISGGGVGVSVSGGIGVCVKPLSCGGSGVSSGSASVARRACGTGRGSLTVAPGIGWPGSGVFVVGCNTAHAASDHTSTAAEAIAKITLRVPLSSAQRLGSL